MLRFLGIYPVAIVLALVAVGYVSKHGLIAPQAKPAPTATVDAAAVRSYAATPAKAAFVPATQAIEGDRRGQYTASVQIDGRDIPMLIDTGASFVALTNEAASELGIRPTAADFTLKMQTANGISSAAPTWLKQVRVGMVEIHDVEAVVMEPGASATSLLGMSFLRKLHHFGVSDGKMRLEQ
ncbi:retropepsin-like aspartic protease family protein [Methyloferula stellata]|uniref:retropepsin-like aspartic protease family protein n=1 Tax=Methyloferula stellata TaxID=876270 RepID=UPI000363232F|nr:TIGR02281 family clan AA aspartic protease [Methyloferula stellata]